MFTEFKDIRETIFGRKCNGNLETLTKSQKIKKVKYIEGGLDGLLIPIESGFVVVIESTLSARKKLLVLLHEIVHTFQYDTERNLPVVFPKYLSHERREKEVKKVVAQVSNLFEQYEFRALRNLDGRDWAMR